MHVYLIFIFHHHQQQQEQQQQQQHHHHHHHHHLIKAYDHHYHHISITLTISPHGRHHHHIIAIDVGVNIFNSCNRCIKITRWLLSVAIAYWLAFIAYIKKHNGHKFYQSNRHKNIIDMANFNTNSMILWGERATSIRYVNSISSCWPKLILNKAQWKKTWNISSCTQFCRLIYFIYIHISFVSLFTTQVLVILLSKSII